MASQVYNRGKYLILSGAMSDWDAGTDSAYQVLLVKSGFAFNADHNTVSEISANESTDSAYARKNLPASSRGWTEDDTNDRADLDYAGTVTWDADGRG